MVSNMREMKDSGIEWIGKMPYDWELDKLGNYFIERKEKVSDVDFEPLSVSRGGIIQQLEGVAKTKNNDDRKRVAIGDFAINSRSDRKQSCGLSLLEGSVSVINTVLTPRNIEPQFVKYLLDNYGFAEEYFRWGSGIHFDLWSTRFTQMKSILLPIPTKKEEQREIANYLDKKVALIDNIIEKTKESIDEYKQYKQSVITETVTKGLNPDVKMKESGIEWIGEIPEYWEIMKINSIAKTSSGSTPLRSKETEYFENADIKWIRTLDLTEGDIYDSSEKITLEAFDKSSCNLLSYGTVLVAMYGGAGTIGKHGILRTVATTNQAVCAIECMTMMLPEYLLVQLSALRTYWMKFAVGTRKDPNISQKIVQDMRIIVPPLDEQKCIANFVKAKIQDVDSLIQQKNKLVEELESYKKSLIYEVVTGKKEIQ